MGYFLDVDRQRIGGKLPLTTYTKQCPPEFRGELMNGGVKKHTDGSYIDSINALNNMSNRITKQKLSEIIGTAAFKNTRNIETLNFHRYFNQPTMRVISSIAIMNLLSDGKLSNHGNRVKHISKIMKTDSSNILQLGGHSVHISSLNHLLNKLHRGNQTGGGERLNMVVEQLKKLVEPITNMVESEHTFF